MTVISGAQDQITDEVTAWAGVHAETGTRGEWSFRLGKREIGHLHGDRVLHIGYPKDVWQQLHDAGRIEDHPVFPGRAGFGARQIAGPDDIADVVALMRINYDRVIARHGLPDA